MNLTLIYNNENFTDNKSIVAVSISEKKKQEAVDMLSINKFKHSIFRSSVYSVKIILIYSQCSYLYI